MKQVDPPSSIVDPMMYDIDTEIWLGSCDGVLSASDDIEL
jgi:hypothetical protein